ncbi:MAG: hypothetical protein FJ030_02380 [Chloroflexi bacterium]|nr:hypothetical protein [Chloroflexota bacterium]
MSDSTLQFLDWQTDEGVGRLTLKKPPLNVVNIAMMREMLSVMDAASHDSSLRVLVVQAEGKMFSAGVDVADHTADKVSEMIPLFDQVCAALANFPAPTLAVVHGHALGGGCEIAMCCDLIVAAEEAKFGQPEIKLATVAPFASVLLPESVGYRRAAEMLLLGENVSAVEAARIGLINRAVPAAELDQTADQYLAKLRALSAAALRIAKKTARLGLQGWANLPAIEKLYLDDLMSTADANEGVSSFIEKRAPVWKHQ